MMVSLGIYVRRGQRQLKRWLADPRVHILAQCVGYLLLGFAASAASLCSYAQPLALGLICASCGWPALLLSIGSSSGYLLFWGAAGSQPVVWCMAGLIIAMVLGNRQILRSSILLTPTVCAMIVAATGVMFQFWQKDSLPVPIYILRVAVAFLSAWTFAAAAQRRDPVVDWVVCAMGVLALAQIAPVTWLNLGYVAAAALACSGALPAAALAGLALDLAQISPVPMTAVMSLAYLLRLLPWGKKWFCCGAPAAVYLLIMGLCGVWAPMPVPALVLGGGVALLMPGSTKLAHRRGETGVAQVRLELASEVLNQTQHLLRNLEEAPVDEQALIARAADRACSGCACRNNCKELPAELPTALLHKPLGNGADLPLRCRKAGRLLQELRRSQEQLRIIRADRDRQQEYRWAVIQQYEFLSEYLRDVSDTIAKRIDPPQQWYQPEIAVCSASRENANGDRCLWFAGVECKYYIVLCDGMGTGSEAAKEGKSAGNMLRKLLAAGYPPEYALRTLNSLCALRGKAGAVTVDLAELQLDTGKAVLYKWGAAPSYVISRGEIVKIGTATPPPGLSVTEGRETVEKLSLRRGETLVLLSDGAGGEEVLRDCWVRSGEPAGELAARILEVGSAGASDDATVAVVRLTSVSTST